MSEYFTTADVSMDQFYQLPKALIKNPKYKGLPDSAKIVYAVLRDRHSVSLKNGWIDEEGHVYFIFSDKELAETLEFSERTARRIKNDLQNVGLISMKRRGKKMTNLIYLLKPEPYADPSEDNIKKSEDKKVRDKGKSLTSDRTKASKKNDMKGQKDPVHISNTNLLSKTEEEENNKGSETIEIMKELGYSDYTIHDILRQMQKKGVKKFSRRQIIAQHNRMIKWIQKKGRIQEWGLFFVKGVLKYGESDRVLVHLAKIREEKREMARRSYIPKPDYDWLNA